MSDLEADKNKLNVIKRDDEELKKLGDKLYSEDQYLEPLKDLRGIGLSEDFETVPVGTIKRLAELESELAKERAKGEKLFNIIEDLTLESDHMEGCDSLLLGAVEEFCSCMDRDHYNIQAIRERARTCIKEIGG